MEIKKDLAYDIITERLDFTIALINDMVKKYELVIKDAELLDIASRLATSMFIQKENMMRYKK